MAAETDDQKGKDDDRRAGADRRRPPLTIDLTAAQAGGKQGARTATPGNGTTLAGFKFPAIDRETWIGFGSAAALGGVVALILLLLLQMIGVLPSPGAVAARQAADAARSASDAAAALDRRLAAVETMTEALPALRADVTAASAKLAAVEPTVAAAAAKSDLDGLRADIASLRTRLDQMPATVTVADLTALGARVARVEATGASAAAVQPQATPPAAAGPDAETRIAALEMRLAADEATISRLSSAQAAPVAANASNARTVALAALRAKIDAGMPFGSELDVVAAFGPDPIVTGLRPYAASGVPTRGALAGDFGKVEDAILAAAQATDESLFGRLVSGARGLVSVRPAGPIAGSDPPAIASRMEAAVATGDLASALREREALPQASKDASAAWAARAGARVAADALFTDAAAAPTAATGKG